MIRKCLTHLYFCVAVVEKYQKIHDLFHDEKGYLLSLPQSHRDPVHVAQPNVMGCIVIQDGLTICSRR